MGAIIYLLQVSGCMAIFYLFYYLLLNRLTFFTINRYYLLATLVLSFIIPLLTIPVHEAYRPVVQQWVQTGSLQIAPSHPITNNTSQAISNQPTINWLQILQTGYLIVAIGLFVRLLLMLIGFFAKLNQKQVKRVGHINIIHGNKKLTNGSFLNYIFLDDEELDAAEIQQVIAHEMLHVRLLHSVDRILAKIIQIILWFNPIAYLYARSIEENHEFEVDREIARSTNKSKYADLLLHLSVASQGMIYNSFSKVPLKKRIIMLFNQPSTRVKKLVYVLVLPVLLLSCMAFATFKKDDSGQTIVGKLKKPVEKLLTEANAYTQHLQDKPNVESGDETKQNTVAADTNKKSKIAKEAITSNDTIPASADMSKMTNAQINKLVSSAKLEDGKFYSRSVLDGGYYDIIQVRTKGSRGEATLPHNAKVAFIVDDKLYDESEVNNFTQAQIDAFSWQQFAIGVNPGFLKNTYPNIDFSKYGGFVRIGSHLDNTAFNIDTAALNTMPNSIVKMLLKIMPGIKFNSDGTAVYNNQPIIHYRVDGKPYEPAEIKEIIKNLPPGLVPITGKLSFNANSFPVDNISPSGIK